MWIVFEFHVDLGVTGSLGAVVLQCHLRQEEPSTGAEITDRGVIFDIGNDHLIGLARVHITPWLRTLVHHAPFLPGH